MRSFETFDALLMNTLLDQYKKLGFFLCILTLLLIIECLFCRTKSSKGISILQLCFPKLPLENRLSLKQQINRKIIGIVFVVLIMVLKGIPIYLDISSQNYMHVDAHLTQTEKSINGNLLTLGKVYVEVNGEKFSLLLPTGWEEIGLFQNASYGTIWYSGKSKILLDFSSNE